jgi:GMP synthase (glutamine-hydrolysing)
MGSGEIMNMCILRHVTFEDEAHIGAWAQKKGYSIKSTELFKDEPLPDPDGADLLVVMGGPMGVYDEKQYPWLLEEKRFLEKSIARGKKIIGICLGAQLLADVLGAKVYKNRYREIGWFPVRKKPDGKDDPIAGVFPETFTPFHWHGDTFDIPSGATCWAESDACPAQAFSFGDRIIALQFHLESTAGSIALLLENCRSELTPGPYIQDEESIPGSNELIFTANGLMEKVMDRLHRA